MTSELVRIEGQQAAYDNGYRLDRGDNAGWRAYESTTAPGRIWITAPSQHGPWYVSLDHGGVAAELTGISRAEHDGPGRATFGLPTITDLHRALDHIYRLSLSLPFAPLDRFHKVTKNLPKSTEAERLIVQRVGQDIFRDALLDYWNRTCPLTGITELELLRASHIVGWAECDSDEHRLNVHNGLLLSALWDAAFDRGLVSFGDDGIALTSPKLSSAAAAALGIAAAPAIQGLRQEHRTNLFRHRQKFGFPDKVCGDGS